MHLGIYLFRIYAFTIPNEPFKDCKQLTCLRFCAFQQKEGVDGRVYLKNIRGIKYIIDDKSFGDCPIYSFKPGNYLIDFEFISHSNDKTYQKSIECNFKQNTFYEINAKLINGKIEFYFSEFLPPTKREKFEGEFTSLIFFIRAIIYSEIRGEHLF